MEDFGEVTEVFVWGNATHGQLGCEADMECRRLLSPRSLGLNLAIRSVSCGDEYSLLLTDTSLVYSLGSNREGRLGVGDSALRDSTVPLLIKDLAQERVQSVACGGGHSLALTNEGRAYSWGRGDCGALGSGSLAHQYTPQQIKLPSSLRLRQVSCGARHSALLAVTAESKGMLLTCGSGDFGQLGSPARTALLPVAVATDTEVKQVSCGVVHTSFTTYTGRVYAMGGNSLGQLGLGNKTGVRTPTRVRALEGVFIERVACGNHTAALSDKGELFLWGTGAFGERLLPWKAAAAASFRQVEVGGCFGAALDSANRLWTWGTNATGELGHSDLKQRRTPTMIQSISKCPLKCFSCGSDFVISVSAMGAPKTPRAKEKSPITRLNLPPVRPRPLSELQSPKSQIGGIFESPISLKMPCEFLFSPRHDSDTVPETVETEVTEDRKSGVIRHVGRFTHEGLSTKGRPSDEYRTEFSIDTDKSAEEVLALRGKLITAEKAIEALSAKVGFLERELESKRDREGRIDQSRQKLRSENAELKRQLNEKAEELAVAATARANLQEAFDRLSQRTQQLVLDNERAAKRQAELQNPFQQTFSPKLFAKNKRQRTLRLLGSITPPSRGSSKEEDLQAHAEGSHSLVSLTQDHALQSSPNSPEKPRVDGKKPKLRNNVSDLKGRLKALRDNQPVLESKISAFERRLRGTMERKQPI